MKKSKGNFITLFTGLFIWAWPALALEHSIQLMTESDTSVSQLTKLNLNVEVAQDETNKVSFSGQSLVWLNQPGEPQIPWTAITLLLPPDTDLSTLKVDILQATPLVLSGFKIINPTPPLVTWQQGKLTKKWPKGKRMEEGRDLDIYHSDMPWPALNIKSLKTSQIKHWKMVNFNVPLYSYNALRGELRQWKQLHMAIRFSQKKSHKDPGSDDTPSGTGSYNDTDHDEQSIKERVKEQVLNFAEALPAYITSGNVPDTELQLQSDTQPAYSLDSSLTGDREPGYTIITTTTIQRLSTALANFVIHKQARGFRVNVVTEIDFNGGTGDSAAENIRSWLKKHYLQDYLNYVLLIGNPHPIYGDIPMKMLYPMGQAEIDFKAPSDYYYADLTGNWDLDNDGFPGEEKGDFGTMGIDTNWEVIVGRIPYYGSMTDLDAILNKIIAYENQTGINRLWRNKALLISKPLDGTTPGWQLGEAIKNNLLIPNNFLSHRIYDENYGLPTPLETTPVTYETVRDVWSGKATNSDGHYGLAVWSTHGWQEGGLDIITVNEAARLNDAYPSFIFQAACDTAFPEIATNLAYTMLKQGGISVIGATRFSWYYSGEVTFPGSSSHFGMAYEFTKRLVNQTKSIGEALLDTKHDLAPGIWANQVVFNLYGDPSLSLPHLRILRVDFGQEAQTVPVAWNAWSGQTDTKVVTRAFEPFGGVTIKLTPSQTAAYPFIEWFAQDIPVKPANVTTELAEKLLQDGIKTEEALYMTFTGLPAGTYEIQSYHYQPATYSSTIDIFVNENGGSAFHQVINELTLGSTDSTAIGRFECISDGVNDVQIQFAPGTQKGAVILNGFELKLVDATYIKGPVLAASPPGFDLHISLQNAGTIYTTQLKLENPGDRTLSYEIVQKPDWLTIQPSSLKQDMSAGGNAVGIPLIYDGNGLTAGLYEGEIRIQHNAHNVATPLSIPVKLTLVTGSNPNTAYVNAQFNTNADNFTYSDDTFRSTANPMYATGLFTATAGYASGGGLKLTLGGVDNNKILHISGGFKKSFYLDQPINVTLSFQYKLDANAAYEPDEFAQVLVTMDNQYFGTNGHDYVEQIADGGTTGWKEFIYKNITLTAGAHTLIIGGYNNKKTEFKESTIINFDNISIQASNLTGTLWLEAESRQSQAQINCPDCPKTGSQIP